MRAARFDALTASLPSLSPRQLEELHELVTRQRAGSESLRSIEGTGRATECLFCKSGAVVRNGFARGLQRYACRDCGKTFSKATGTPLSGLRHKERFIDQGRHLAEGLTIRQSAREMGVSLGTALRWRHRFLEAAVGHQGKALEGLLEADETYFRENKKGCRSLGRKPRNRGGPLPKGTKGASGGKNLAAMVPVLVLHMRGQPYVADKVLGAMTKDEAVAALREMASPEAVLCVDGSGAFRTVEAELGVRVEALAVAYDGRTRAGPEAVFHIQTVNSYHERLKGWIYGRMRGVATKNMPNYLAWMRIREWFKDEVKPEHYLLTGLNRQLINT